ncbi:Uncharacterized protein, DUF1810 family [Devosia lucknowensis]|uniref:Uncharacterized protein, DUF1810 family n=1 Tax=Devosia lucknowensis TaxID=1096929 RepID=A0A1Y6G660_9HYPH|nr:DUF1810 domain-containing protein [Devosia lucknowensis]SMQ85566.1 Uncharacterized protein, DUF1810 family [Devosia lucknowensis]
MTSQSDIYGALIAKFLAAQDRVYPQALGELRAGRKQTHWMWFIFPQLAGLGHSDMARRYALGDLDEAAAYAAHPVLGARLLECTEAVLLHTPGSVAPRDLRSIFGTPDDLKFISSMTLFARTLPDRRAFRAALSAFNGGHEDERTVALLETV